MLRVVTSENTSDSKNRKDNTLLLSSLLENWAYHKRKASNPNYADIKTKCHEAMTYLEDGMLPLFHYLTIVIILAQKQR